MQLGQSLVVAEPVEGLADREGVDARIGKRDRLRRAENCLGLRDGPPELCEHRLPRLDGDHLRFRRNERTRQLAGSGAEIDYHSTVTEIELVGEPLDRLRRILRPRALVQVGNELERARIRMLKVRHAKRDRGR